jgi:ribosomal RNA-processing protein 1
MGSSNKTIDPDAAAAGGVHAEKKKTKETKELTKRARRSQPNDQHKWPQHPKIQSMAARNKAYIRVAGVGAASSSSKTSVIDPALDLLSPEVKFGRLLGGTDQRKRHAAVHKLKAYLTSRCDINNDNGGISELDLMKLWKGLWYTLYMADKVPVQDELSKRLAELIWCVAGTEEEDEYAGQAYMEMCEEQEQQGDDDDEMDDDDEDVTIEEIANTLDYDKEGYSDEADSDSSGDNDPEDNHDDDEQDVEELDDSEIPHCRGAHLASLFVRTFFRTIRREWGNMDKYRVDKFYTLVRLYMHEIFKYMAVRHWNLGIIRLFNDCIFEEILNQTPNGLRYHLIDIAVEELAKVNAKAPMPLTEATFLDTLEPYFAMAQTGAGDNTVQERVLERILSKFLDEYSVVSDKALKEEGENGNSNDAESLIFDQVHVGSVSKFIFDLASDSETKDRFRKSLYDMHKKYERRLKTVGNDIVLLPGGEEENQPMEDDDQWDEDELVSNEEIEDSKDEPEPVVEEPVVEKTTKKNKKKKQSKEPLVRSIEEQATNANDEKASSKKEKTKRKSSDMEGADLGASTKAEKKKKTGDKSKNTNRDEEDEVVTISLSEQNRAKAEANKKTKQTKEIKNDSKKKKQKKEIKNDAKSKSNKVDTKVNRVKFDGVNRSKSYKASMKDLTTKEPPKTSLRTPEKSILMNKGKITPIIKAGRKKAVNYF